MEQVNKNSSTNKIASYQKYFQGYTEVKVAKKRGNGYKILRIYTDPFHVHRMSDEKWMHQKILYGALSVMAIILFVFASQFSNELNSARYVAFPGVISVFGFIFLTTYIIAYLVAPRKMTIYICRHNSRNVKAWSLLTAVCLACVTVACVVYACINHSIGFLNNLLCSIFYAISFMCVLVIHIIEKKTLYREEANRVELPFDPDSEF